MRQILITGGAGFIGSHTAKHLAEAGYLPVVLDNLATGHRGFARYGLFIQGDVRDPVILDSLFSSRAIEGVIHFAGATQAPDSAADPLYYYQNNVGGALALISAMRRHMVETIVFSSTCALYGPPFGQPLAEDHPLSPQSPYANSKHMVETLLNDMAAAYGFRHMSLRYFNAAGADADLDLGERHVPESHPIAQLLQTACGQRGQFDLPGDDHDTPDGTAIRDFVHVSDLADAHVLALRHLQNEGAGGVLNLGSGRGHSLRETIEVARRVTGREIAVRVVPRRPDEPPRLVADISRARQVLGWEPKRSELTGIVASAWAWHKKEAELLTPV